MVQKSYDNKKKGYQPRDYDQDERSYKKNDRQFSDAKKPYASKSSSSGSYQKNLIVNHKIKIQMINKEV